MKSLGLVLFFLYTSFTSLGSNVDPDWNTFLHEFHLSKCLVDFNSEQQAVQISMHLFIDDLEKALSLQGADQLFICTKEEHADAKAYILKYLRQKFTIEINGFKVDYNFLGKELSDDQSAVWCFMEITGVDQLYKLKIDNSILMEVFDDQKNIINISGPKNKKGFLLFEKGDSSELVTF